MSSPATYTARAIPILMNHRLRKKPQLAHSPDDDEFVKPAPSIDKGNEMSCAISSRIRRPLSENVFKRCDRQF